MPEPSTAMCRESQLLRKLRQENHLRPVVQGHLGQQSKTLTLHLKLDKANQKVRLYWSAEEGPQNRPFFVSTA